MEGFGVAIDGDGLTGIRALGDHGQIKNGKLHGHCFFIAQIGGLRPACHPLPALAQSRETGERAS